MKSLKTGRILHLSGDDTGEEARGMMIHEADQTMQRYEV